jgi:hypothetical protein
MESTFFHDAVAARFAEMANDQLYVVASNSDAMWSTYLTAFPPGSDPIFRVRTEHDCSCCRHFIRDIGNVVAIQNGAIATIWDLNGLPEPYQTVADAMAAHIKALPIRDVFLTKLAKSGAKLTPGLVDGKVHKFVHFFVNVPSGFVTKDVDSQRGTARTTHAVLTRGLLELKPDALATVAGLIADNAIYRGQEFQRAVTEFAAVQSRFLSLPEGTARELLAWTMLKNPAARFRNTVIGTLVQDLSDGMPLDAAVRAFETKVAPANYKRPTALITKGMVDAAMKTIGDLGLEPALERRHAKFADVSVNSVLFVDNSTRTKMRDSGIKGLLMDEVKPAAFDPTGAAEIGIDEFVASVLPKCTSLHLYVDNAHAGNFVSMTAPVHADAAPLFRWPNNFAWSYDGNVADSIKDRVKQAGGKVEGVTMRASLAWFNFDDLDLHVIEPSGAHIYFGNKRPSPKGGALDVDMNISPTVRNAVENIRWTQSLADGVYRVSVCNFTKRESIDVGFVVEIESSAGLQTFRREQAVPGKAEPHVCSIHVRNGVVEKIVPGDGMIAGAASQEKWRINTLSLARVNSVVLSPNYWDDNAAGNKHWFFILEGCKNPLPTRGIYNEFLSSKLEDHRKVFEVLGDKTKCAVVDDQMSGLGFSSTRRDKVTVAVSGPKLNKTYAVTI